MIIGLCREHAPGETRVALTPENIKTLVEKGQTCLVEAGAGTASGYLDEQYREAGAELVDSPAAVYERAELIAGIQMLSENADERQREYANLRSGQIIVGMLDPLSQPEKATELAEKGIVGMALELVPRISRAQSMDVLSSMATLGGYHAVLLAASHAPRILPMMMTAAGTLQPARVLVLGTGVAGLQACATAKRLGAVVSAYDIRPAARDQILSVGATPVDLELETEDAEGAGGYAKEQSADQLARQQAALAKVLAEQDIVITTAAVPGKKAPVLITEEMAKSMQPGSVVVDIAAERGGNCALTRPGETVDFNGVTILGPLNLPARHPLHASQMFGNNLTTLLTYLIDDEGRFELDFSDAIVDGTVITHHGEVTHAMVRELLGLPPLKKEGEQQDQAAEETGDK